MTKRQQARFRARLRAVSLLSPEVAALLAVIRQMEAGSLENVSKEQWEIWRLAREARKR
jgi:hypothetical protein